jgi:hypothetical protein
MKSNTTVNQVLCRKRLRNVLETEILTENQLFPVYFLSKRSARSEIEMEIPSRSTPFITTHESLLPDDYVSPNLQVIMPDRCFPQMKRGNMECVVLFCCFCFTTCYQLHRTRPDGPRNDLTCSGFMIGIEICLRNSFCVSFSFCSTCSKRVVAHSAALQSAQKWFSNFLTSISIMQ